MTSRQLRTLAFAVAVVSASMVTTVLLSLGHPMTWVDVSRAVALAALGVVATELGRRVERLRRFHGVALHVNMMSVWFLPAAVVLPPALTAGVVAVLYLHMWFRCQRGVPTKTPLRTTVNASILVLTCQVVWVLVHATDIAGRVLSPTRPTDYLLGGVTMIAYWMVNSLAVMPVVLTFSTSRGWAGFLGTRADNALEFVTLCLGLMVAVLLTSHPGYVVLVVVVIAALHQNVLVKQLKQDASTDGKTGLLNATAWQDAACRAFHRTDRDSRVGVLMIDLDHFKRVNDTYGHQTGDRALAAVAAALQSGVRVGDVVGRYGGEEFVALLSGAGLLLATGIADRLRVLVERLALPVDPTDPNAGLIHLTVSIGVAVYPAAGHTVDDVVRAADHAVYTAKNNGRNRVHTVAQTQAHAA